MTTATHPDFRRKDVLVAHIRQTLDFYFPHCIDPRGGFYHFYKDDGRIYDRETRHLVSSARFVFARAWRQFGEPAYLDATRHGLAWLRDAHHQGHGGYAWALRSGRCDQGRWQPRRCSRSRRRTGVSTAVSDDAKARLLVFIRSRANDSSG